MSSGLIQTRVFASGRSPASGVSVLAFRLAVAPARAINGPLNFVRLNPKTGHCAPVHQTP